MKPIIVGKNHKKIGKAPAIVLCNPKYPHNVGQTLRACSCFGVNQVWFTGERVSIELEKTRRIPREERMKGYMDVDLYQYDYPFDMFEQATPVAIELQPGAENLAAFEHPENPIYVFGPEDGSINQTMKRHCHRFVVIPTRHCTNLSAAVYLILYDRMLKRFQKGIEPPPQLAEERGWYEYTEGDSL